MSRKDRKNRRTDNPPAAATNLPPDTSGELDALRERLDRMEKDQAPRDAWAMVADRHRIEREREIAAHTRANPDTPCRACGDADAVQRRLVPAEIFGTSAWICTACVKACVPGWGTQTTRALNRSQAIDRLACLAVGMDAPTASFAALAGRYGLRLVLAQDAPGAGDGTPWSHLGDLAQWREAGIKATRRSAAGFGAFPAVDHRTLLAPRETELRRVWDPELGAARLGPVEVPPEPPTAEELAARLCAEEIAIEAALKDQVRQAREQAEQADKDAERTRIAREYRAAARAQEKLFQEERHKLREARRAVYRAADTKVVFNAIVGGI
ncbi:hypothetical protein [Streptomyces lunaelactis]|nr:hypothetical protein [Streptomyces lunaelactis]NUK87124.1 hypothetical protein [Streptomyces lunaelactis]